MSGLGLWRRHRQVIGLAAMAVVVALGCVALGSWQWSRYQQKSQRKQVVERSFAAPVVPLSQLAGSPSTPLARADQWRPVRVSGRYLAERTVLVRNRPRDVGGGGPTFGYEVLVPLLLDDGSALLVDRGWLPSGTTGRNPAQQPDAVPSPPTGRVEAVVRLRPSERERSARTPPGQVASIAVGQVARSTGLSLYRPYGVLVSETPPASPAPALIGKPQLDGGEGVNASYAVQWLLFAALALGFPIWWRRRQRALVDADSSAVGAGTDRSAPQGAEQAARTPVATAPRRRRIWDDEEA